METSIRSVVGDYRAWILTAGLLGSYAIGFLVPDSSVAQTLGVPAFALMFVYMITFGRLAVGVLVDGVPIDFFVGFGLFCFLVATLLVRGYDRLRRRGRNASPRGETPS